MKVTAVVLLCAMAVVQTPDGLDGRRCTVDTASDIIQAPDADGLAGCQFQSMAYIADTMPKRTEGMFMRVMCTMGQRR